MKTVELLNYTPHQMLGVKEQKGNLFGIELELEGRNVGLRDVATRGWNRIEEGSLRGESIEYVTAGPKSLDEAKSLVTDLFKKFDKNEVKFNDSIRTSTHVHLNFSDKPVKQAINFFALFTLLEEVLQYYSGEDRKGNLFCLSAREGEGIVGVLSSGLARGSLDQFAGDRYKYGACNLSSLYQFGSVEVRTMRSASSAEQVNKWLDILNDMYEYSLKMESPATLIGELSMRTARGLMGDIFKEVSYRELMKTFPPLRELHASLMEGARLIQIFAYEFDEDFKAVVELKEKRGGNLPTRRPGGGSWTIWRPDGIAWDVVPLRRGGRPRVDFWRDGDVCEDDRRIVYSEERQRFIVNYPDGSIYECNWNRHPTIPDEGPGLHRDMIGGRFAEVEPEEDDWFEPEHDEEEVDGDF